MAPLFGRLRLGNDVWLVVAAALLVAGGCRDYGGKAVSSHAGGAGSSAASEGDGGDRGAAAGAALDGAGGPSAGTSNASGGSAGVERAGGGGGHAGSRAGASGHASPTEPGQGGAVNGGEFGAGSSGMVATSGGNAGSTEAGSGGEETGPSPARPGAPGEYGAVRVLVDGQPTCGGTLIHNRWVLTAASCIPTDVEPSSVVIGYGADANRFAETHTAVELDRYPVNEDGEREHDLALIGVDAPFLIDGSRTRHYFPIFPVSGDGLGRAYRCAGWDLTPDPASPTDKLRVVDVLATYIAEQSDGEVVWWENSLPADPAHGDLLTQNDLGSGCFTAYGNTWLLATVHTGNPSRGYAGQPNEDQQAYSLVLSAPEIQNWMEHVLAGTLPAEVDTVQDWQLAGPLVACSTSASSLDAFGVKTDGTVGWYRRSGSTLDWQAPTPWSELPPVPAPSATSLTASRLGVLCWPDGSVDLVATGAERDLWWQHRDGLRKTWLADWLDALPHALSDAGVSLAGLEPKRFEAFFQSQGSLIRSRYDNGWLLDVDVDVENPIAGTPAARMGTSIWVDVEARGPDGTLYTWSRSGATKPSWSLGSWVTTPADPGIVSFKPERNDIMVALPSGTLGHSWYEVWYTDYANDSGLALPTNAALTVTSREPGQLDVLATGTERPLWHAVWPRNPVGGGEPSQKHGDPR